MAGTEHPNPIIIGTKLLPERPNFLNILSITNAILAMYPLSSNNDRKKNNTTIMGKKLRTLPTPTNIPSIINDRITSFTLKVIIAFSHRLLRALIPISIRF